MKHTETAKAEARQYLLELFNSDDVFKRNGKPVIYTTLEHVSRSGMSRTINLYISTKSNGIERISHYAAILSDMTQDKNTCGIKIDGVGMDMGFALVYDLSMSLYCPDKYDHDSAYQLLHEWL